MQSKSIFSIDQNQEPIWQSLADIILPSQPGSAHLAGELIAAILKVLNLSTAELGQLKFGVTRAMLNAIKQGNRFQSDLPITIRILASAKTVTASNINQGSEPITESQSPDLAAKVVDQQPPRGWGFFLIEKTADNFRTSSDEAPHHTIELFLYLEGGETVAAD